MSIRASTSICFPTIATRIHTTSLVSRISQANLLPWSSITQFDCAMEFVLPPDTKTSCVFWTFSALCIPAILSLICVIGVAAFSSVFTIFSQYLGEILNLFLTKSKLWQHIEREGWLAPIHAKNGMEKIETLLQISLRTSAFSPFLMLLHTNEYVFYQVSRSRVQP